MVTTACPKFAVAIALIEIDRPGEPPRSIAARVGTALVRNPLLASQFADVKRDEYHEVVALIRTKQRRRRPLRPKRCDRMMVLRILSSVG
jgi:hypothetical protein